MAVKRKPILRKAPARNAQQVKFSNFKKRLSEGFKGMPPKNGEDVYATQPGFATPGAPVYMDDGKGGLIEVPSNGGGGNVASPAAPVRNPYASQVGDALRKFRDEQAVKFPQLPQKPIGPGGIQIDPREAGGFDQIRNQVQQDMQGGVPGRLRQAIDGFKAGLPNKQIPVPMPGFNPPGSGSPAPMPGGNGMIHLDPREWGENGGFGGPSDMGGNGWKPPTPTPGAPVGGGMIRLDPREWGENGGFGQPGMSKPMPQMPGGGMIRLDPREWGENGGFNQPPKPNPLLGGGKTMPLPSPGRMPQPNPKRNLIPRPIDPRFKMM